MLRALRLSRDWDVDRMARELHHAARAIGEPVAEHTALVRMIRTWEDGKHSPRERYRLLYRRVFPGEWNREGADAPDPAAVLKRALRAPGDAELSALENAAQPGEPSREEMREAIRDLKRQVDALSVRLAELLREDRDE